MVDSARPNRGSQLQTAPRLHNRVGPGAVCSLRHGDPANAATRHIERATVVPTEAGHILSVSVSLGKFFGTHRVSLLVCKCLVPSCCWELITMSGAFRLTAAAQVPGHRKCLDKNFPIRRATVLLVESVYR